MEAIHSLQPDAQVHVRTLDDITWIEGDEIPKAAIETEIIRGQAEYDAQAYSRNREAEYPSIQECVHAILDDDLTALQTKRQAVKDKYPKPE